MKTRSRNLLISFLVMIAMLLGVFAMTPLTASAASSGTPTPEETPAETVYVGGVALQMDQYVMNGSSTAVDGTPLDDANGFAWYSESGLLLVNYVYEGQGYLYDGDNYAVISSTGYLVIEFNGTNKLTQTEEYGTGIYAGGHLVIDGFGPAAECLEVNASFALYTDFSLFIESNAKGIKINSDYQAMSAYDLIVLGGGDIDVTTYFPISLTSTEDTAQIVILDGSVEVKSEMGAFSIPPYLDDYNAAGREVEFILSENSDGSDPLAAGSEIDIVNFSKYKYFCFGAVEVEPEYIESISVSGADLPEVGETKDVMEFTPDTLTYGGEYKMVGRGFQKYTGTEWVDVSDTESLEYGVKYRLNLVLAPNEGYAFADSITSDDVTFNGEAGIFETLISGVGYASICYEFSYEAPVTDYGIIIADKDDSGATVGVLITEENCTDVLGDGTVSYDPTTNTLTLNGYKYEGEGFLSGSDYYYGICVTEFFDDLTLVLAGENVITLTELMPETYYTGIELWNGNMTIKGDGSLAISSPREGICVYGCEDGRGALEIKGGNITIINANSDEAYRGIFTDNSFKMTGGSLAVGATYGIDTYVFEMNGGSITVDAVADYSPCAICAYESFLMNGGTITASATGEEAYTIYFEGDFTMNGGSLKISSDYEGISCEEDSTLVISGGTLEISTKEAGYAFTRYVEDEYRPTVPTVTGDYSMTASVNEDGSGAVIYDEDAYETYKYVKIAFVTDYGITIADKDESGATVGVDITSANCTDVLGDGTVSYNPTTNTLTLNGYKYDGEGCNVEGGYLVVTAEIEESLTIKLIGENKIDISGVYGSGFIIFGDGDVRFIGDGSLTIDALMYGISVQSGDLIVESGNVTIDCTGMPSAAIAATNFYMIGGNLKLFSAFLGIGMMSSESDIVFEGGVLEVSVNNAGYCFVYNAGGDMMFNPMTPEIYCGAYDAIASTNTSGGEAVEYNPDDIATYKYAKITEIESYGITIADKDDSGATVGVLITEENYTDVLGDGTVSYDPTTNTLTLNGYKYEGSGFEHDRSKFGIYVPDPIGTLNIVLKGENVIDVTKTDTLARIRIPSFGVYTWETDVVFSGDGSLVISATDGGLSIFGEDAPSLEIKGGNITVNAFYPIETAYFKMSDGNLTVNAIAIDGDTASAIYSDEFKMTGGNLKITSDGLGVEMWHDSDEDAPPMISGGTFEISVRIAGGAFCYYNYDEDVCVAIAPDLTNYVGAYKLTAGANADGTGATDYNASDIATYKYVKAESTHVHDHGTTWVTDANEHWNECECGDKANKAAHTDSDTNGKCDVCGADVPVAPPSHTHNYGTTWKTDANNHWKECECGDVSENAAHIDGNGDNKCDTCDYAMPAHDPDDPGTTPPADNPPTDDDGGLGTGAIVGIVVGSVAVAGVGGFAIFWFVIKKKTWADFLAIFKKK